MNTQPNRDDIEIRPGTRFEGSRPGKGTAVLVFIGAVVLVGYAFWPSIASALHLG
ncbi:MAG TPA: hypothetical protein VL966_15035 [Alphaproteobacteria bacterium]|jgi:hypothetical protein|nr:hypothetical protein [Alphaproteobacteria bacterium]